MRRRLYFVLPDLESAKQVENDLLLARIEERHMHFLARRGTDLGDLPEASVAQKTDFVHGMKIGLVVGAAMGLLVGLIALFSLDMSAAASVGILFALTLLGAGFGLFAAGLVASSTPNSRLRKFEDTLEEGHILLMVDVPVERVEEISELVKKTHPEAENHGIEPTVPAFP